MKLFENNQLMLKLKDKNTWLLIGIAGLLLLVIALPDTSRRQETEVLQEETSASVQEQTDTQQMTAELEKRLEQTLSLIDGAGEVRVMLTLQDTGEKIVEKDLSRRSSNSGTDESTDESQSSVYVREGSTEQPYVSRERLPQVEGVLVVAQGGGNSLVKQNILQAVMSLFPLEAHKITIVKMSMQEVSDHENF